MIDEVLGVNVAECAAQYAVAVCMNATPASHAEAVLAAIDEVRGVGRFWEPLRELERVAVETLPGFEEFLPEWRALVEERAQKERRNGWDSDVDRWRREVAQRPEGAEGLAKVARSTKRADDLRAWCRALVDAGDWKQALSANDATFSMSGTAKVYDRMELRARGFPNSDMSLPEGTERSAPN
jgi:hypothetical protein